LELALFTVGIRLEAIGYMVFERLVDLETVDELMGGFTLIFWSRAEAWGEAQTSGQCGSKGFRVVRMAGLANCRAAQELEKSASLPPGGVARIASVSFAI